MTDVMTVNMAGACMAHGETSGGFLLSCMKFFWLLLARDQPESVNVPHRVLSGPPSGALFIKEHNRRAVILRWRSQIQQSSKGSSAQAARNQTGFILNCSHNSVAAEMIERFVCFVFYTWVIENLENREGLVDVPIILTLSSFDYVLPFSLLGLKYGLHVMEVFGQWHSEVQGQG